jgi:hypothetical protein
MHKPFRAPVAIVEKAPYPHDDLERLVLPTDLELTSDLWKHLETIRGGRLPVIRAGQQIALLPTELSDAESAVIQDQLCRRLIAAGKLEKPNVCEIVE